MRLYTLRPHHRRRHRKKLRLAEFGELGFPLCGPEPLAWQAAPVDPLEALLVVQGWCWDGERRPLDGFVSRFGGGSLTEVDRELMRQWLRDQGAGEVQVGTLQDRWEWIALSR